jgi:hypothetical protein
MKSIIDSEPLMMAFPLALKLELDLQNERRDNAEPAATCARTENEEPNRDADRRETELPIIVSFKTDRRKQLPSITFPCVDSDEPIRAKLRILKQLPTVPALSTEQLAPYLADPLRLIEDPSTTKPRLDN